MFTMEVKQQHNNNKKKMQIQLVPFLAFGTSVLIMLIGKYVKVTVCYQKRLQSGNFTFWYYKLFVTSQILILKSYLSFF